MENIIAFHEDGTWNTPKDNSNIVKLHKHFGGKYFKGPGTKATYLDKYLGGVFGNGCEKIANNIYDHVTKEFHENPRPILGSGFSRGAGITRSVVDRLVKKKYPVKVMICFDTVTSLGIPLPFFPFQLYDNMFMNNTVHPDVGLAIHAMAADEHRVSFQNTPMDEAPNVIQQEFSGGHWEIGSGATTFRWALDVIEKSRVLLD